MTAKRDFKRRVRQRQAHTGESYVTARRHVVASRPDATGTPADAGTDAAAGANSDAATAASAGAGDPGAAAGATANPAADGGTRADGDSGAGVVADDAGVGAAAAATGDAGAAADAGARADPGTDADAGAGAASPAGKPAGVSVVELIDVTDQAKQVGLLCPVSMFPLLAERIEPARVLSRLRDVLVATLGDPETAVISGLALAGQTPRPRKQVVQTFETVQRFLQRARAGLGGVSDDGAALAFQVADRDGMVSVLCSLSARDTALVLASIDDLNVEPRSRLGAEPTEVDPWVKSGAAVQSALFVALHARRGVPALFLVHEGRRYPILGDEFVIGRDRAVVDLAIKDGMVSRRHAAVTRRSGAYYIKDLGSVLGIIYKGMHIDYKRIEEGDVFEIGGHEIRFTFRADGR